MPAEPVTVMSLLGVLITVAAQGVWGNRADALICGGIAGLRKRLDEQFKQAPNHDVARAVYASFVQATHDSCQSLLQVVQNADDQQCLQDLSSHLPLPYNFEPEDESLSATLAPHVNAVIAGEERSCVPRDALANRLNTAVSEWSRKLIGRELSQSVRKGLLTGLRVGNNVAPPWSGHFRRRLAEAFKSNERFRNIITAQNLASLVQSQAQQSLTGEQLLALIKPVDLVQYAAGAAYGSIQFVPEGGNGSLGFSHLRCKKDVQIRSGQGFTLEVPTIDGHYAAVIEGYRNDWVALPVNCDGQSPFVISEGKVAKLPPEWCMMSNDCGVHRFLAISVAPAIHSQLDPLMRGGATLNNAQQRKLVDILLESPQDEYIISYGYMVVIA